MKNYFSINISEDLGELSAHEVKYSLTNKLSLKLNFSGSCNVIDSEEFFYFRFGRLLAEEQNTIDEELASTLKEGSNSVININSGYFGLFFFNKATKSGLLFADRVGIFNVLFSRQNNGLTISNEMNTFEKSKTSNVDKSWLTEIVNFRISSGSHTYDPSIRKVPAGQSYSIDENLALNANGFYWEPEDRTSTGSLSIEEATEHSLLLLNNHLDKANVKNKKVAVLLSGGVDSSLLTALTHQHNNNVIAVTPVFVTGDNPELEIAKQMAASIHIEHQVIEITDEDIKNEFACAVQCLQQPIRSPHALIFSILMRKFKGKFDAVVFGEGADTIFGYHGIKQAGMRYEKQARIDWLKHFSFLLRPFKSIPQVEKLHTLVNESITVQVSNSWSLDYVKEVKQQLPKLDTVADRIEMFQWLGLPSCDHSNLSQEAFENLVRKFLIQVGNVDHFYTMGTLANRDGIELICPFLDVEVVKYASQLHDKLYLGKDFVKPILRRIGTKFYPKELMYLKKKGFPVPHKSWLSGPLAEPANQAKEFIKKNFDEKASQDNEFVWLVMALQELNISDSLKTYHA